MLTISSPNRAIAAWCLYDWANSAYVTVITTFIFAAYFTQKVAADVVGGTAQWGYAISLSGVAIAIGAPILGAVADRTGRRKPWLALATVMILFATAGLWFIRPDPAYALTALVLVAVGNFCFEVGQVFYNAMLPDLAPRERLGRVSGWGWGLGYAGGLACLGLMLVGFIQTDRPWFGLDPQAAEPLRASALVVTLWFGLFALPLFFMTPRESERTISLGRAVAEGIDSLLRTLRNVREHGAVARYLLAHMIYADGLNTLFAFGGIYAAGSFGFDFSELILFGIVINVTAGLGAALFGWVDDWIGPKRTILIGLGGLILLGAALVVVEGKTLFWIIGIPLGIFCGPTQAASRSLMAHLAPADLRTEMFGLYALAGKATAFVGPALLAWATMAFDSQRMGMATILLFFIGGGLLLMAVPAPRHGREA